MLAIENASSDTGSPDDTVSETLYEGTESPNTSKLLESTSRRAKRVPASKLSQKSRAAGALKSSVDATSGHIEAYTTHRNRKDALVSDLPTTTIIWAAQAASDAGLQDVMDNLATDVVEKYQGSEAERLKIATSLVLLNAESPLLSYTRLHSILLILESSGSLPQLPNTTATQLTKFLIGNLPDDPLSVSSLSVLLTLLDKSLRPSASLAKGAAVVIYRPPEVVQLAYFLIQKLLRFKRDQQALDVFQLLVKRNNIPPEAVRQNKDASPGSTFIMLSTLVRSCLHWGWRRSAVELCRGLLRAKMAPSTSVIDLTLDVLYALLESPTAADLGQFCYLARELAIRAVHFRLPHGLFRVFYDMAHKRDVVKAAEVVYEYTQSNTVVAQHEYPSPQGHALTWLLRHLATTRNAYLGRRLTTHVVDSCEPIPLQDRARFITITASCGYALQARILWDRYTVGRDRDLVLGSATVMLRMVSLFLHTMHKNHALAEETLEGLEGKAEEDCIFERKLYEDRKQDASAFAHHIVAEFRRVKEPLTTARHWDLTSLARACFMLGDVSAGFDVFKTLIERKEIPDLYDINVALSAMAEYSPQGAAGMIQRMIQLGIEPDPITFGTVIHFASMHRDTKLVSTLLGRAREVDNGKLTLKSVQALIKASIEVEETAPSLLEANLLRALQIIQSLTQADLICSPHTGMYCISASLMVDNPVIAFRFWTLLVQRKVEWNDTRHSRLRSRIAAQIRTHCAGGWVDENQGKIMLHALLSKPKIYPIGNYII